MDAATFSQTRRRLRRWYRAHHRDLPWRRTRNPYHIWVAEIMLQQTRVDVVVPYYVGWLRRFPSVAALAAARENAVLQAWAGLGYYHRARSLHAAAKIVAAQGGKLPQTAASLQQLPGIGRTTAGAIASQAFGLPAPILDGNVARVLSRLEALSGAAGVAPTRRRLWALSAAWARCRDPGTTNQALMELGATVCTPAKPRCTACPLTKQCKAHRSGDPTAFPRRTRRLRGERLTMAAALVRRGEALLLVRRTSGRLLRGFWEVPALQHDGASASAALRRRLRERGAIHTGVLRRAGEAQHGILAHRLHVEIFTGISAVAPPLRLRPRAGSRRGAAPLANLDLDGLEWRWVRPAACRRLPLTTLTRKLLSAASASDSAWQDYLGQNVGARPARERRHQPAQ